MTGTGTDGGLAAARARYVAARDAALEASRLEVRVGSLREQEERSAEALATAKRRLAIEVDDSEQWAGKGFAQLLLWLVGRLDERRDTEQAESLQALVELTDAYERHQEARRLLAEVQAARAVAVGRAGDLEPARRHLRDLLGEVEPNTLGALSEADERLAAAQTQRREVDEAIAAAAQALTAADSAVDSLGSASSWGAIDLIGGGLLTSMIKRERVAQSLDTIHRLNRALDVFRTELQQVLAPVTTPSGLEIGATSWTFDVWFDNIFSDWAMQSRIGDAQQSVRAVQDGLNEAIAALRTQRTRVEADTAAAGDEIERLLAG
jgi:hypothetical protein